MGTNSSPVITSPTATPMRVPERHYSSSETRFARSVQDWAAELGLSYLTVYRAVKSGALPAKRCGRRIIIIHEDVMGWVSKMPPAKADVA